MVTDGKLRGMQRENFHTVLVNLRCDMIKGNEFDLIILILSYRLKGVTNSNVLHCLQIQRFAHISGTRFRLVMSLDQNVRFEMDK